MTGVSRSRSRGSCSRQRGRGRHKEGQVVEGRRTYACGPMRRCSAPQSVSGGQLGLKLGGGHAHAQSPPRLPPHPPPPPPLFTSISLKVRRTLFIRLGLTLIDPCPHSQPTPRASRPVSLQSLRPRHPPVGLLVAHPAWLLHLLRGSTTLHPHQPSMPFTASDICKVRRTRRGGPCPSTPSPRSFSVRLRRTDVPPSRRSTFYRY